MPRGLRADGGLCIALGKSRKASSDRCLQSLYPGCDLSATVCSPKVSLIVLLVPHRRLSPMTELFNLIKSITVPRDLILGNDTTI